MAGERYEQENQSRETVKRHEREARHKQARVRLPMDEYENFIIDEEAAPVVKQIYSLCLAGNGPTKIARMLTEQEIPTPGTLEYRRTGRTRRYHPGYEEAAEKHTVFQVYFYNTQKIHQFRLFWWIFCDLDKISDYFKCYLCLFFVYQLNNPFKVYCHRSLHLHVNET